VEVHLLLSLAVIVRSNSWYVIVVVAIVVSTFLSIIVTGLRFTS
jgi:hypothetical protein